MNNRLLIALGISFSIIAAGCVTSLQPLVTYDKVSTDPRFAGTWVTNDQEYQVKRINDQLIREMGLNEDKNTNKPRSKEDINDSILAYNSYFLRYKKDNLSYLLIGSLIRINNQLFIDITPLSIQDSQGKDINEPAESRHTHSIAKVIFRNTNSLELRFLSGAYDLIHSGKARIKHEQDDLYGTLLITAATTDLRSFLEKYGNDEKLYDRGNSVTLLRKI